jgi:hypothetical protein
MISMMHSLADGYLIEDPARGRLIPTIGNIKNGNDQLYLLPSDDDGDPLKVYVAWTPWIAYCESVGGTWGTQNRDIWGTYSEFGVGTQLRLLSPTPEQPDYAIITDLDWGLESRGFYKIKFPHNEYKGYISQDLSEVIVPRVGSVLISQKDPVKKGTAETWRATTPEDVDPIDRWTKVTTGNPSPSKSGPVAIRINNGPTIVVDYDKTTKQFIIPLSRSTISKEKITHYCSLKFPET